MRRECSNSSNSNESGGRYLGVCVSGSFPRFHVSLVALALNAVSSMGGAGKKSVRSPGMSAGASGQLQGWLVEQQKPHLPSCDHQKDRQRMV